MHLTKVLSLGTQAFSYHSMDQRKDIPNMQKTLNSVIIFFISELALSKWRTYLFTDTKYIEAASDLWDQCSQNHDKYW